MTTADRPTKMILVAEDDAAACEALAVILARAGYRLVAAADGQQALDLLAGGLRPDVILLDMLMPVLDGWHFLTRLRSLPGPAAPVIITTGTVLTREWATAHGCAGFVKKPFDPDELLVELLRVLGP